jgi:hypothetical protein
MNSETLDFINKYVSLCDKTNNLIIYLGKQQFTNCFDTDINVKNVTNILKYLENKNHKIIYNSDCDLSIHNNIYTYNDNGKISVVQYEICNFILNSGTLLQFTKVTKDSTTFTFDKVPYENYKCSIVVFNIIDGCNLEIIKKNNKYCIRLIISKPCDSEHIIKFLSFTA